MSSMILIMLQVHYARVGSVSVRTMVITITQSLTSINAPGAASRWCLLSVNSLPREPHDNEHRKREEDADQKIQHYSSDETR